MEYRQLSSYRLNPASITAFCPVTVLDATNVLTCSATSSTVAKRFNLFASLTASSRAGGKESPQSYGFLKLVAQSSCT